METVLIYIADERLSFLKAKYHTAIYPTGEQLSLYGRWDGLILSLLSYQFESIGFG